MDIIKTVILCGAVGLWVYTFWGIILCYVSFHGRHVALAGGKLDRTGEFAGYPLIFTNSLASAYIAWAIVGLVT